jgi:hypothetical protein
MTLLKKRFSLLREGVTEICLIQNFIVSPLSYLKGIKLEKVLACNFVPHELFLLETFNSRSDSEM